MSNKQSFFDFTDFRQSLCTKSSSSWIPGLGGTDCNSCGRLNQLIQESSSVFDLWPIVYTGARTYVRYMDKQVNPV